MNRKKCRITHTRKNRYKSKRKKKLGEEVSETISEIHLKNILLLCIKFLVENEKKKQLCNGETCSTKKGNFT